MDLLAVKNVSHDVRIVKMYLLRLNKESNDYLIYWKAIKV